MSNQGRALISALNAGDYQSVDQYTDLSDLDLKVINHHVHELFERAIRTENFKLFRALLKIPRVQVSSSSYCTLGHAVRQGLVDFVSDIVRVPSVNPNIRDEAGYTALHKAILGKWAQKKGLDLVRAILLIPGVKTNIRDKEGRTALHHAMDKQWFEVATLLVEAGAHPKIEDGSGTTALTMALPLFADIPADLWDRMLQFDDDLPEEEEADVLAAVTPPDDDDPPIPVNLPQQATSGRTPGISTQKASLDTPVKSPPPLQATPDPQPQIQQTHVLVQDSLGRQEPSPSPQNRGDFNSTSTPPLYQSVNPGALKPGDDDRASLETIMGDQALDDTLMKEFLFLPADGDSRPRFHRKAVMEHFGEVAEALRVSGQRLTAVDCRFTHTGTGYNLWHAAALHGSFPALLELQHRNGELPEPDDLMAQAENGHTPASLLDNQATLQAVLSQDVWYKYPQLLTALLAGLPDKRRRSFATLISKAHLLLLSQQL